MSFRYGYTWSYDVSTGGGKDANGDPIAASLTSTPFECDAQTDKGSFSADFGGDNVTSSFFVAIPLSTVLTFNKGQFVTDHNGKKRRVINFIVTKLSRELWVE